MSIVQCEEKKKRYPLAIVMDNAPNAPFSEYLDTLKRNVNGLEQK